MRIRPFVVATTLAALSTLTACSGEAIVSEADLEADIKQQLTETVGQAPDSIDCPGDLAGALGEGMRCTLEAGGQTFGVTIEVTGIDGGEIAYDAEVDQKPQ